MPPKKVAAPKKKSARSTKAEEESDDEVELPTKRDTSKKPAKDKSVKASVSTDAKPRRSTRKVQKDESESDEEVTLPSKTRGKNTKQDDDSDDQAKGKSGKKAKARKKVASTEIKKEVKQAKGKRSTKLVMDSDSEIEDEVVVKSPAKGKKGRAKSQDESLKEDEVVNKKAKASPNQPETKIELDSCIPLSNVNIYKEKKKFFAEEFIEPHPIDEKQNKFFIIQLLENYSRYYSYYRFGTIGTKGEWIIRGEFDKKRAKVVYDEKIREQTDIVKKAEANKGKADAASQSQKYEKAPEKKPENGSQPKIDVNKIDCPPDSFCPLKNDTEVLVKDDFIYDKKLNVSNLNSNSNHFYMFQVLRNKTDHSKHYVFYRYGRVGLSGEWVLRGEFDEEKAIELFRAKEAEQEKRGKYTALDMNYNKNQADTLTQALSSAVEKSSLPKSVAKLIQLIFDFKMINDQMNQAGFDTAKSPLGKLAVTTIEKAFQVLNNLSEAIKNNSDSQVIENLSSQFFTLIPTNVGWKNMKSMAITTESKIKEKLELLESLRQVQIAYELASEEASSEENPIDKNYKKLNCKIEPVDTSSNEYKLISKFVENTRENNNLEIEDMFTIRRDGETERFKGHIENHLFLWHGSRLSNFVGILSQGLRIAPPEAPASGYRLGKGIYLADMISKSVPYCFANSSNKTLCIMICEAALGDFNEKLYDDFNASQLPSGKHSTKALGRVAPALDSYELAEPGVKIPTGKPIQTEHKGSAFQHNEFVVYDVSQVRIRYLLRIKVK